MFHRARTICTPDYLPIEVDFLINALKLNGFPLDFINKYSQPIIRNPFIGPLKAKLFLKVPFNSDSSFSNLKKRLNSQISKVYPQVALCIIAVTNKIWNKSLKDNVPMSNRSHCIYKFSCKCGSTYIGKTRRCLISRVKEHLPKYLSNVNDNLSSRKPKSSIAKHLISCNIGRFNCNIDSFQIIAFSNRFLLLNILEALYINSLRPDLCIQKELVLNLILPW